MRIAGKWSGGYLEAYYDLKPLSQYIADISARRFRDPGVLYVVSSSGVVLGHADDRLVLDKSILPDFGTISAEGGKSRVGAAAQSFIITSETKDASGEGYISFYAPLLNYGMGLAIREKKKDVFIMLAETSRLVLLWSCGALLAGVLLAYLLTRGMLRSLNVLVGGIKAMTETRRPGLQIPVFYGDEIGDLAEAFNGMSAKMEGYINEITDVRLNEEMLRRTLDVATLVVDAMPNGVVLCGGDGLVRGINRKARALLGISQGESMAGCDSGSEASGKP